MAKPKTLEISTFDNRLMDGLLFCRRVFLLFDQVRATPDGVGRIRLRKGSADKKLVEELLPIARYVQHQYSLGRRLKIRWVSGSQQYDAILYSHGKHVELGFFDAKVYLEVTRAVHSNEYLLRELGHTGAPTYSVKGVSRNKATKQITSAPHVHHEDEIARDLGDQMIERLTAKAAKTYPKKIILVIECIPNAIILEPEWDDAVRRVKEVNLAHPFKEVFLFCDMARHSAMI